MIWLECCIISFLLPCAILKSYSNDLIDPRLAIFVGFTLMT